jgi:hypothetical protein
MFESFDQAFYHIRNEWKQQARKVAALGNQLGKATLRIGLFE